MCKLIMIARHAECARKDVPAAMGPWRGGGPRSLSQLGHVS